MARGGLGHHSEDNQGSMHLPQPWWDDDAGERHRRLQGPELSGLTPGEHLPDPAGRAGRDHGQRDDRGDGPGQRQRRSEPPERGQPRRIHSRSARHGVQADDSGPQSQAHQGGPSPDKAQPALGGDRAGLHPLLVGGARADAEGIGAPQAVAIDGGHAHPPHPVLTGTEQPQLAPHGGRVALDLLRWPHADVVAVAVEHLDPAETQVQRLAEAQADGAGRLREAVPGAGIGGNEAGVGRGRRRRCDEAADRQDRDRRTDPGKLGQGTADGPTRRRAVPPARP